jgi:thioredoxin-related protein
MLIKFKQSPLMKKLVIALFALPILALLSLSKPNDSEFKIGDAAPLTKTKMVSVDDKKYTLEDLRKEEGLVVVFSCNTCPFVVGSSSFKGWEGTYNQLSTAANQQSMGFVLVNANEAKRKNDDSLDEMKKRAKDKEYKMPYLVDKKSSLANAFGAKTTPHVFVLDKNMKLVYAGSIDNTWDSKRTDDIPYLENVLKEMAADENITTNMTPPRGCSIKRK